VFGMGLDTPPPPPCLLAALAAAVRHAVAAAGGAFGAVGHLTAFAAPVGDAVPLAGIHLLAPVVGAAFAAPVHAAQVARRRAVVGARRLGALLVQHAAVLLAQPRARGQVVALCLGAPLGARVVFAARAARQRVAAPSSRRRCRRV
jgi:hypothetical protein